MSNSKTPSDEEQQVINGGEGLPLIIVPESLYKEKLWSMEERTKKVPELLHRTAGSRSCSIFRIPQNIMKLHPRSFQPEVVSIGPYHRGEHHLQMVEEHKWRILGMNLGRLQGFQVGLDHFFKALVVKEKEIRACYAENIDIYNTHELIEMMILDGCFIIEVLCVFEKIISPETDDPIFNLPWMMCSLTRDLLRLENQIPFFVLQILYKLSISDFIEEVPPLQELVLKLFKYSLPSKSTETNELRGKYWKNDSEHILDFYRSTFIPSCEKEEEIVDLGDSSSSKNIKYRKDPFKYIQPVEKLHEAGIKFKERKDAESFLDMKFRENGVLEVPRLAIDDMMSSLLLNCVAFEQCYRHRSKHFTSYVIFMGCLINTVIDAGYLRHENIIENFLGTDEEVVKFFNEVGRDLTLDVEETYLGEAFKDVDKYYRNVWHVGWAEFKYYVYFGGRWVFLSAGVAFVLLLLTILQSFFSVYAYFKPPQ